MQFLIRPLVSVLCCFFSLFVAHLATATENNLDGFQFLASDPILEEPRTLLIAKRAINDKDSPLGWWERRKYNRAVKKFPNLLACINPAKIDGDVVDLKDINWDAFDDLYQLEVCLFWIAHTLHNADETARWFRAVGFEDVNVRKSKRGLNAHWSYAKLRGDKVEDRAPDEVPRFVRVRQNSKYGSPSISIKFDLNHGPWHIRTAHSVK